MSAPYVAPEFRADVDELLSLARWQGPLGQVQTVAGYLVAAGELLGSPKLKRFGGFDKLGKVFSNRVQHAIEGWQEHSSDLLESLLQRDQAETLCTLATDNRRMTVLLLHGVPMIRMWSRWYSMPCDLPTLWAHCFPPSKEWSVTAETIEELTAPCGAVVTEQTRELIAAVERYAGLGCYALALAGPPGSGKSTAARQIAAAIGGTRVQLAAGAANNAAVWELLRVLRPATLILDDVDRVEVNPALLSRFEQLHAEPWCRAIISTANRPDNLPGALLRPGRCNDRLAGVVRYDGISEHALAALSPRLTDEQWRAVVDQQLLAAYCAQIERGILAGEYPDEGSVLSAIEDAAELQRCVADGYTQKSPAQEKGLAQAKKAD